MISQGISAGDAKKPQDAGIYSCNSPSMQIKKDFGYMTTDIDVLLREKPVFSTTTGSQALNELLGGIGTLCITGASLPVSMRGRNGKVAYIDTEGSLRLDRIVPIAERFGMYPGVVLDNHWSCPMDWFIVKNVKR